MAAVRRELRRDAEAVHEVHVSAFGGEEGVLVAALVDQLRSCAGGVSLVATDHDQVVGHVMLTASLLDAPPRLVDVHVLSPLGVLPAHQQQGVGAALVEAGLRVVEQRGVPLVFVEGSAGYYSRFGFVRASTLGFRKPSLRIPDESFQVLPLRAYEPWMSGTLVYAAAFWENDAVGLRSADQA